MSSPAYILMQKDYNSWSERSAVITYSALTDVKIVRCKIEDISKLTLEMAVGVLPVGSVEFVREFMRAANIQEPENISYPEELKGELKRSLSQTKAGLVLGRMFVKPVNTKKFTGFVFDTMNEESDYPESQLQSYRDFMAVSPDEPVWVSEEVNFKAEFRAYIVNGEYKAIARYDDHPGDDIDPPIEYAKSLVERSGIKNGSIDVGILDSGEPCLVECNDAWALGLYGTITDMMSERDYIGMLWNRWQEISNYTLTPKGNQIG